MQVHFPRPPESEEMEKVVNMMCLLFFTFEILLGITAVGLRKFLLDPWNRFDLIVVGCSWAAFILERFLVPMAIAADLPISSVPAVQLQALRATRIVRVPSLSLYSDVCLSRTNVISDWEFAVHDLSFLAGTDHIQGIDKFEVYLRCDIPLASRGVSYRDADVAAVFRILRARNAPVLSHAVREVHQRRRELCKLLERNESAVRSCNGT